MKALFEFLKRLIQRTPLVFLVLGVVLMIVAAVTNGWLSSYVAVDGSLWRIALFSFGAILALAAVRLAFREDSAPSIDYSEYGILIDSLTDNESYTPPIIISGPCEKELPGGIELWVSSISGSGSGAKYWPQNASEVKGGRWSVNAKPNKWKPGDRRKYGVFLVGPNGQALIHCFKMIGNEASSLSKEWSSPGIVRFTNDIVQCGASFEIRLRTGTTPG